MNPEEIEQLARAVASHVATGRARPSGSARESAEIGWRMPIAGASAPAARGEAPPSGATDRADAVAAGPHRVADYVDHTLLKAEAKRTDIEQLCREAVTHRFAAVCVNGSWVSSCAEWVKGSGVKVATVVGFPLGAMTTSSKAEETRRAIGDGADEIDMVAAVGHLLDGDWDYVEQDIRAVVEAAAGRTVKVILETGLLEPMQIVRASAIAMEAGAHFVKTSTGFHAAGGATAEAVALMRLAVGDRLGVKASGGVRDCETALEMIAAGASRIGTSSGVQFVECLGAGPMSLAELLSDPERHGAVCRTGRCGSDY